MEGNSTVGGVEEDAERRDARAKDDLLPQQVCQHNVGCNGSQNDLYAWHTPRREALSEWKSRVDVNHNIGDATTFSSHPGWLAAFTHLSKNFADWAKGAYILPGLTEAVVELKKMPDIPKRAMDAIHLNKNGYLLLLPMPPANVQPSLNIKKNQVIEFLNYHYGDHDAKMPWKKLNEAQPLVDFISLDMLLMDFVIIDPLKMTQDQVKVLLNHWRVCEIAHGVEEMMQFLKCWNKKGIAISTKYDPLPPLQAIIKEDH
ncbi:hypothetical protein BKA93DRAFT_754618 [Sparassis latifolia]